MHVVRLVMVLPDVYEAVWHVSHCACAAAVAPTSYLLSAPHAVHEASLPSAW